MVLGSADSAASAALLVKLEILSPSIVPNVLATASTSALICGLGGTTRPASRAEVVALSATDTRAVTWLGSAVNSASNAASTAKIAFAGFTEKATLVAALTASFNKLGLITRRISAVASAKLCPFSCRRASSRANPGPDNDMLSMIPASAVEAMFCLTPLSPVLKAHSVTVLCTRGRRDSIAVFERLRRRAVVDGNNLAVAICIMTFRCVEEA
mmetsp:Transcript_24683/g.46786  ORF Transcript_24683/g.46786 Transcript_24683/m.46786 type:complete len:213 (-) Transcript_24683:220-858(-)